MSEVILLDTHIWIWLVNEDTDKIPAGWLDQISAAEYVGISPITCYEISLAVKKGRLILPTTPADLFRASIVEGDMKVFPLTPSIADQAVNLTPVHKDPFDRLIIATALTYNAKLASVDATFEQYDELRALLMSKY